MLRCRRIRWKIAPMLAEIVDAMMISEANGVSTEWADGLHVSTLSYT